MSNQRKAQRRREIEDLRDQGFVAFHAGVSLHSNPHRNADEIHWRDGWQQAEAAEAPASNEERIETLENEVSLMREVLAQVFVALSGKAVHTSDCATSNAPAEMPGPCDCDVGDLL